MKLRQIASNQTELVLRTNSKAFSDFETDYTILFSYQTPVACHVAGVGYFKTLKKWSVTTSKHINAWLRENDATSVAEVSQETFDALCAERA